MIPEELRPDPTAEVFNYAPPPWEGASAKAEDDPDTRLFVKTLIDGLSDPKSPQSIISIPTWDLPEVRVRRGGIQLPPEASGGWCAP